MSCNNAHALDLLVSNTAIAPRAGYGLIQDSTLEARQAEQIPDDPVVYNAPLRWTREPSLASERLAAWSRLGSIDEQLTEISAGHCLAVFHDILHMQLDMREKNVLHRDFSMYNCSGLHGLSEGKTERRRTAVGMAKVHGSGEVDRRTYTLASHSSPLAFISGHEDSLTEARSERTGSAMFVAVEVANPRAVRYNDMFPLEILCLRLEAIETDAPEVFRTALPHGNDGFMQTFRKIAEQETKRRYLAAWDRWGTGDTTQPRNLKLSHETRHDCESAFWVFLWAFSRTRPLGSDPEAQDSSNMREFQAFCRAMLTHEIDGKMGEVDRRVYLKSCFLEEPIFHSSFVAFGYLFLHLALYLTIPWHLYATGDDAPKADHVHVAFRRLILGYLFSRKGVVIAALDTPLDTEQPRSTTVVPVSGACKHEQLASGWAAHAQNEASGASHDLVLRRLSTQESELAAAATMAQEVAGSSAASSRGSHRRSQKRAHDGDGDEPRTKRLKASTPEASSDDSEVCQSAQATMTDPMQSSRSVSSLRLKFWKDTSLWFGSGRR